MIHYADASFSAHVPGFIGTGEIDALLDQAGRLEWKVAEVRDTDGETHVSRVHRRSRQVLLDTPLARTLVGRIGEVVAEANERWGLEIGAMMSREPWLILCDYRPGDFFHWHRDWCPTDANRYRKIGTVMQLADGSTYEGGNLEFFTGSLGREVWAAPRELGTLIVFASISMHRVSEVRSGHRVSAMSFAQGLHRLR